MSFKYKVEKGIRFGNEIYDILKSQGVENVESFLNPTSDFVIDEMCLDNINEAVNMFSRTIKTENPKIGVLVDCDCDGYTSAALMYQYLQKIKTFRDNVNLSFYIHEGKVHGLSDKLDLIIKDDLDLLIIPDASTGDIDECKQLQKNGTFVIILDHHNIDPIDNPAIVVNNQLSSTFNDKAMTGVGITYKFCKLLDRYYNVSYADDFLDLVAVGMIGDRCNLFSLQSRYYVLEGIKQIQNNTNKNKLISVMFEAQAYSMNNKVTVNGIGFYICPLINALIRLGSYEEKKLLFKALCNDSTKLERKVKGKGLIQMSIQEYVLRSCQIANRKQKKITAESAKKLISEIDKYNLNKYPILVVNAGDDVDINSTGLVANQLVSIYNKPTLLLRRDGDVCKGSGRGYDKCNITNFNVWCVNTKLCSFVEGHAQAFGIEIPFENTYKLYSLLQDMPPLGNSVYNVYGEYSNHNFSAEIVKNVAKYDYVWGCCVEEPMFVVKGIICNKYSIHLGGSRQNKIEFLYHDIKFIKMAKGTSLLNEYNDIMNLGETIEFNIVGLFRINNDNTSQVIIVDWDSKKSDKTIGFGFG